MTDALQDGFDSAYQTQLEAKARDAVANLARGQQWEDWLVYGEYVASGRTACLLRAGTNEPVGLKYNKAMAEWLTERPWVCDVDKVSRSHAIWCFDHREELKKLRDNMGVTQSQLKNHPTVMKRAFDKAQRESQKPTAPKAATSKADLEQQVTLLTDERDKWRKKAESADMLFDLKNDSVKLIVPIIASEVSMNKLRELATALKAEFDRRSKIKNGGAK